MEMEAPFGQGHWTLSDDNSWMSSSSPNQWHSISLDPNTSMLMVPTPLYSQNVALYPSYVPYYDIDVFESKVYHVHDGVESPLLSATNATADDYVPVGTSGWSTAIVAHTSKTVVAQVAVAQVAIEDQLNSQSLYKTELCRSFEETGTCRYGAKCQFAHGKDELRPVLRHPKYKTEICRTFHNSGSCPYGKRCRFIHLSADEGNLNSINIIPWTRTYDETPTTAGAVRFVEPFNGEGGCVSDGFDVDDVASKMRALDVNDNKGGVVKSVKVKANRKAKAQRRKNPNRNSKTQKAISWDDSLTNNNNNDNDDDHVGVGVGVGIPSPSSPRSIGGGNGSGGDVINNASGTPEMKSSPDKNENKRRLAFFARLSGDTGIQTA